MHSFSFRTYGGGALAVAFIAVAATNGCSSSSSSNDSGFGNEAGSPTPDGSSSDSTSPGTDGSSSHDSGLMLDTSTGADTSTGDDGAPTDAPYAFDGYDHLDGYSEASYCPDDDGDGFTVCDGDCNDHDSLVNPCAFDTNAASGDPVGIDGVDNDCDGTVDNRRLCDSSLTSGHDSNAGDYATAMDICPNADPRCIWVKSAIFYGPSASTAHRITAHMGNNAGFHPHAGAFESFFATGISDDDIDTPAYRTGDGTDLMNTFTNPSPLTAAQNVNPCGTGVAESTVAIHDYTELRLTLLAPVNAGSFTFDFNFFSEEYPVYVCQGFNDTFLAMQTSQQYPPSTYPNGFEVAFDPNGHRVNVNNSFFQDCNSITNQYGFSHTCANPIGDLTGTGYEIPYGVAPDPTSNYTQGNGDHGSGATDWLKTTSPIVPGETFTLSFIIFDEHDGILDSAVNLDNFRWNSTTLSSPVTGR
jgi:hypothetical protein